MIQFTFVLLFSLIFGISVATEPSRPDLPKQQAKEHPYKRRRLYLARPREWGEHGSGRNMQHPVVVLGPDPLTNGQGTLVVEISHNPTASFSERAIHYYPKDTMIPATAVQPARKLDRNSMINVGEVRVVRTSDDVFVKYLENLDMSESNVRRIENQIKAHNLYQWRHESLLKHPAVRGMGDNYGVPGTLQPTWAEITQAQHVPEPEPVPEPKKEYLTFKKKQKGQEGK
ncbi:hypothetical protein APHAL10511_004982 [Amanita phalloides]|nr:hypothetical protein APHAL10511_004982 [Amanita phalloides]